MEKEDQRVKEDRLNGKSMKSDREKRRAKKVSTYGPRLQMREDFPPISSVEN